MLSRMIAAGMGVRHQTSSGNDMDHYAAEMSSRLPAISI